MDAKELKVGNYVSGSYYDDDDNESFELCKVLGIDSIGFSEYPIWVEGFDNLGREFYMDFEPVPLTEKWLLDFGFEKEKDTIHGGCFFSRHELDCKYSFAYADFRKDWGFYHSFTDACLERDNNKYDPISFGTKYVHQLQNLYFALTSKELTK